MSTPQTPGPDAGQPYQPPVTPPPGFVPPPSAGAPQPPASGYPQGYGEQPPAGYPQGYGEQPAGAPQPTYADAGAYPLPGQAAVVPVKKKRRAPLIVLGVILLLIFGVGGYFALTDFDVKGAKVGDCLAQVADDEVKTVACDSTEAKYRVVSIIENQPEPTDATNPCAAVDEADSSYWEGKEGGSGRVLCLKDL